LADFHWVFQWVEGGFTNGWYFISQFLEVVLNFIWSTFVLGFQKPRD